MNQPPAGSSVWVDQPRTQVTGSGDPVTCFVPGLLQPIADLRVFGSGVAGRRVFYEHGDHTSYAGLAAEATAAAAGPRATRAVGVSLGAGALLNLLARDPSRFERVVLALPAAVDQPRSADLLVLTDELADAVATGDQIAIGRGLLSLQPESVRGRSDVKLWVRRRASEIGGTPVTGLLRALPRAAPVETVTQLGRVEAPILVLGQRADPTHPTDLAERLVSLLPNAELVVCEDAWVWSGRTQLREVISGFLNH